MTVAPAPAHPPVPVLAPAPAPSPAAIELRSVEKTYPGGTRALEPIDLRVEPGEFVTLLGPSGCGKSSLLRIIAGLLTPSAGEVRVQGRPVSLRATTSAAAPRLAFVFQAPTLMPWAGVRSNVRLPLDLAQVPRAEADRRAADALALVGLDGFADASPQALSGGMQMRVSIARALVTEPQLLLMDEPFGALDEITRHRLDAELMALWAEKRFTVVFVTHSIHEAVLLSQRVLTMAARPGRIVDALRIEEPHPRSHDFLVTREFAQYAAQLQRSLLRASGGDGRGRDGDAER